MGFPDGSDSKEPACNAGFDPGVQKIPWRSEWLPTPVLLPGEAHGQRNPVGYHPRDGKELDMTGRLTQCWKAGGPQSRYWQMGLPGGPAVETLPSSAGSAG